MRFVLPILAWIMEHNYVYSILLVQIGRIQIFWILNKLFTKNKFKTEIFKKVLLEFTPEEKIYRMRGMKKI